MRLETLDPAVQLAEGHKLFGELYTRLFFFYLSIMLASEV